MRRKPPSGPPDRDPQNDPDADPPGEWDPDTDPVDPVPVALFSRFFYGDISRVAAAFGTPTLPRAVAAAPTIERLYRSSFPRLIIAATVLLRNPSDYPTAEIVVQNAFGELFNNRQSIQDEDTANRYLWAYLRRQVQRASRRRPATIPLPPEFDIPIPSAEDEVIAAIERSAVIAALQELPDTLLEPVVLRYFGDLTTSEIAATMGISRGAVSNRLRRGLSQLRKILEAGGWR